MRVLFYEPNHSGHHFAYFERMLPGFLQLPIKVGLATTSDALSSEEFRNTLAPLSDRIELIDCCRPLIKGNALRNARRRTQDLRTAVDDWQADHVCVLYADGIWETAVLGGLLGKPFLNDHVVAEAWMYRGGFAYSDANRLVDRVRRRLFRKLLNRGDFAKIHFDDELTLDYVASLPESNTQVVLPANPVKIRTPLARNEAQAILGIPSGGPLMSSSGRIARFKGSHLALEAFAKLAGDSDEPYRLLLAGPYEQAILDQISEPALARLRDAGRLIVFDRFLSEEEMLLVAEASDLVLAPYPNHSGRSSIILWAAAAGVPVLAVNRGCIEHVVERQQLGATCNVQDISLFAKAMQSSLATNWREEDVARVRDFARWHSIENYQQMSASLVRERLSAAPR